MKVDTVEYKHCCDCPYADNKVKNGNFVPGKYRCTKKNKTLPDIWVRGEIPDWCPLEDKVETVTLSLSEMCLKWRNEGIKEVVEWIHENSIGCISYRDIEEGRVRSGVGLSFIEKDWEAKLKEWGIGSS